MKRADLPLVTFTLLGQLALGAVVLAAMQPLYPAGQAPGAVTAAQALALAAAAALLTGLAVSLLHLGTPLGAVRALGNLGSSWLAREVLFSGLFAALTLGAALSPFLGLPTDNLLMLSVLTGLAAVFTMARVYQVTIHPAWSTPYTAVSFFSAAALLGVAAGAVLLAVLGAPAIPLAPALLLAGGTALVLQLAATVLYGLGLANGPRAAREAWSLLASRHRLSVTLRFAASLLGLGALTFADHLLGAGSPAAPWLALNAAVALVAGELMGRLLFFAAGVPNRVGI